MLSIGIQKKHHHSTETALLRVQSDILRALDNGDVCALILLDLSADYIGLSGTALAWATSISTSCYWQLHIGASFTELWLTTRIGVGTTVVYNIHLSHRTHSQKA